MIVEIEVSHQFHENAPFWQFASVPGVCSISCNNILNMCVLTIDGSKRAIKCVARLMTSYPVEAQKVLDDME